ncbi:MAG: DUF3769 domain-containing protein [Thainema sp.]
MPYPVLPPDLPPVVQTSQPESSFTTDPSTEAGSVVSSSLATSATDQSATSQTQSSSDAPSQPSDQPSSQATEEGQASSPAIQAHVSLRLPEIATPEIFSPNPTRTHHESVTGTAPDHANSNVETSAHSLGQPMALDIADFAIAPTSSVPAIAELRSQLSQAPLPKPEFSTTPLSTDFGHRAAYSPLASQTLSQTSNQAFSQAAVNQPAPERGTSFTPLPLPSILHSGTGTGFANQFSGTTAYVTPTSNPAAESAPHSFFPLVAPGEALGQYLAQHLASNSAQNSAPELGQADPDALPNQSEEEPLESPSPNRPVLEIPTTPPSEAETEELPPESAGESTEDTPPDSDETDGAEDPTVPVTLEESLVELQADRQEYDTIRRIFEAEGNVVMRYGGGILDADQLRVNLVDRIAIAEGNVALTRGEQVIRGDFFEYNFVQGTGEVTGASGEIFLPTTGGDLSFESPGDPLWADRPVSDRITANQPVRDVRSTSQINVRVSDAFGNAPEGEIRRLRFEADSIEFDPNGWIAQNIRITNDPFSPPELELRAEEARLNRISPLQDEVLLENPRLVLDQGLQVPLLRDRIVLDRRERDPSIIGFGFDEEERGGFFVEGNFEYFLGNSFRLSVKPQIFVQRAFDTSPTSLDSYGLVAELDGPLDRRTFFSGQLELTSLEVDDLGDDLRARATVNRLIPTGWGDHNLALQYIYRDRLFNGSLGFQNVQESFGAVFTSPRIRLGNSGFGLRYQASAQYINANTTRLDLLELDRTNNRVSLGRFQASAALDRSIYLWQGEALPATPDEGLRYTPRPLVPYVSAFGSVLGVLTEYTSGDSQNVLRGTVGLRGQFGHFSRDAFDYTAFTLSYSDAIVDGLSPFRFDQLVDQRVIQAGFTQQIIGPFLFGVQTSFNLDSGTEISTSYILEYSRRTYGIIAQYNPARETGSISLRINDFNWNGTPAPFDGDGIRDVDSGIYPAP